MGEDRHGFLEVVRAEPAADDPRYRTGAAADGERDVGHRRSHPGERGRDRIGRSGNLCGGRRIVSEVRTREPQRADVGRPDPGGPEQRGADGDLGGAAADVDDRDDLRQFARGPGDGAVVREPALAVGSEGADRQAGRLAERCREGRRRGALPTRGSDDHRRPGCAQLPCPAREGATRLGRLRDLPLPERARSLDLGAEAEVAPLLDHRHDRLVGADVRDEEACRVGADIDDRDAHLPFILAAAPDRDRTRRLPARQRVLRVVLPSVWRRARSCARRIIAA